MNNKMKKINEIRRNKPVQYAVVALAGLLAGWLLFSPSKNAAPETYEGHEMHKGHSHDLIQDETGVWTCSMHLQIRQDKPGKCPICAMDLTRSVKVAMAMAAKAPIPTPSGCLKRRRPWQMCRLRG